MGRRISKIIHIILSEKTTFMTFGGSLYIEKKTI